MHSSAIDFLRLEGYYNVINGYSPNFKNNGVFYKGTTFEEICNLYAFDKELRSIIYKHTSSIESHIKALIAHEFSRVHGVDEKKYLAPSSFTPNSSAENLQNLYTELNNGNLAQNVLRILTANFDEWYPKWFANNEDKNPYTAEKKENRKLNSILSDNQNIGTILTISEIPQSTSRIDTKENLLPSMIPNVYTGRPTAKGKFAPQTGKNALGMQ
jgi:abortive infection bacteriophage resistance protein